ncbi:hypothetical protein [Pseudoxanthomonas winnipegensis]|uniref:Uncharacterized protein n=1 Tax=Pseudoxanthomonas winnipegensis TaxID=2480810 RepID=A0A4Q8M3N0_9GAMM|nr:hypothetical protein [Pseudoxanthomonas winnipegensis]TAA42471.1 hypothetical protein EA655_10595 [Pseudoxanthomonas winnipegensis]
MADQEEPASWQLLEFLKRRVQLIQGAGFRTQIGAGVIILDDTEVPDDPTVAATIIEAGDASATGGSGVHVKSDVDVTIEYSIPRGQGTKNPKLQAHRARADLMKVLIVKSRDLPQFISTLSIVSASLGSTADQETGVSYVIAQVTVRAGLVDITPPANS